jgi:hypothetical protein
MEYLGSTISEQFVVECYGMSMRKCPGLLIAVEENGEMVERPKYKPYGLRHFYASMLIDQKINLTHSNTDGTPQYSCDKLVANFSSGAV